MKSAPANAPASLARPRLRRLVLDEPRPRITTVIAPAGFGKSMLLTELVQRHEGPTVHLTVDGSLLRAGALGRALDAAIANARAAATGASSGPLLIAIDDVHMVSGWPAEADLAALLATIDAGTSLVLGGRFAPPLDLLRFRLDNVVTEIGANELRFRSWEVEELFHRVYRFRLPPQELAALAEATDGWAAGLQLFRHAVARTSDSQRRLELQRLRQSRLETVRSYLAANVLASLDDDLRSFVLRSCVLGRLDAASCNRLLDRIDAQRCLDRLVDSQLFTVRNADGSYRYHDVFRSFLEAELATELAPGELARLYHVAAGLLEERGALADSLRAFTLAGSAADAARVLALIQAAPLDTLGWADSLPDGLLADQWLRLARARMLLCSGRPRAALDEFARLADDGASRDARIPAAREADVLRRWLQPMTRPADRRDWRSVLRMAVQDRPMATDDLAELPPSLRTALSAAAALLDGQPLDAARQFGAVDAAGLPPGAATLTTALSAIAWWLAEGLDPTDTLEALRDERDAARDVWPTRLLRALLLAFPYTDDPPALLALRAVDADAERNGDPWTPAIARLAVLLGASQSTLRECDTPGVLAAADEAVEQLAVLGAPTLVRWCIAARRAAATAPGGDRLGIAPSATQLRTAADHPGRLATLLRTAGVSPVSPVSLASLANPLANPLTAPDDGDDEVAPLVALLRSADVAAPSRAIAEPSTAALRLRCFGVFEVLVDGTPVDLTGLRPQAVGVLRQLASRAGRPIHRDVLTEQRWPGADPAAASRRLHVAISAIRHALGAAGPALARRGETYVLGGGAWPIGSDLDAFDRALAEFDAAARAADDDAEEAAARSLVALHAGPLFVEEGAADWVVGERERTDRAVFRAVARLAALAVGRGDFDAAVRHAEAGLRIDRFRDDLWVLLFDALDRSGRRAELERARRAYDAVLEHLGVAR